MKRKYGKIVQYPWLRVFAQQMIAQEEAVERVFLFVLKPISPTHSHNE